MVRELWGMALDEKEIKKAAREVADLAEELGDLIITSDVPSVHWDEVIEQLKVILTQEISEH